MKVLYWCGQDELGNDDVAKCEGGDIRSQEYFQCGREWAGHMTDRSVSIGHPALRLIYRGIWSSVQPRVVLQQPAPARAICEKACQQSGPAAMSLHSSGDGDTPLVSPVRR